MLSRINACYMLPTVVVDTVGIRIIWLFWMLDYRWD